MRGASSALLAVVAGIWAQSGAAEVLPRPNLYFGTTTRSVKPVQTGLAWLYGSDLRNLRHQARKEDAVETWGWVEHDGRSFGVANVTDSGSHLVSQLTYLVDEALSAPAVPPSLVEAAYGEHRRTHSSGSNESYPMDDLEAQGDDRMMRLRWDGTCGRDDWARARGRFLEPLSIFFSVSVQGAGASLALDPAFVDLAAAKRGIAGDVVLRGTDASGSPFDVVLPVETSTSQPADFVVEEHGDDTDRVGAEGTGATASASWLVRRKARPRVPPVFGFSSRSGATRLPSRPAEDSDEEDNDAEAESSNGPAHTPGSAVWAFGEDATDPGRAVANSDHEGEDGAEIEGPAWASRVHFVGVRISDDSELWRVDELIRHHLGTSRLAASRTLTKLATDAGTPQAASTIPIVPVLPSTADPNANVFIFQVIRPPCGWTFRALVHHDGPVLRFLRGEDTIEQPRRAADVEAQSADPENLAELPPATASCTRPNRASVKRSRLDLADRLLGSWWARDLFRRRQLFRSRLSSVFRIKTGSEHGTPSSSTKTDQPVVSASPRTRAQGTWLHTAGDRSGEALAQFALSNLLGSITFFHGRQVVLRADGTGADESGPFSLLTGMPARSFFPRGFMWDEGFHQLLVAPWDPFRAVDVLAHWLNLMDSEGWVAREQILGAEARSRVPREFVAQSPDIGNPPTLFLAAEEVDRWLAGGRGDDVLQHVFSALRDQTRGLLRGVVWAAERSQARAPCDKDGVLGALLATQERAQAPQNQLDEMKHETSTAVVEVDGPTSPKLSSAVHRSPSSGDVRRRFLLFAVPRLLRQLEWYRSSQRGDREGSFRWRGTKLTEPDHTFASGLDDFPRGVLHTVEDEHVDLLAWIAFASRTWASLARSLRTQDAAAADAVGVSEAVIAREETLSRQFAERLHERHWSDAAQFFCDWGVAKRPDSVQMRKLQQLASLGGGIRGLNLTHVCHVGYVGLFPLALRLLDPADPHLGQLLHGLRNESALWSPRGLRSLSKSDRLYRSKEDYWRGAIWINVNYLTVSALRHYASQPSSPYAALAATLEHDLQANLVRNLEGQWARHGSLWESYDPDSGQGRGVQPFTGWSALVVRMMKGMY